MNVRLFTALLMVVPVAAWSQEEAAEGPWSGSATLGYLATSGNTENSTLNTAFGIGYTAGEWTHGFSASAIHATEDDATTAEAYEAAFKSEWSISDNNYLFGRLGWRKDLFSSYESQTSETIGYGRRLIDSEVHVLNAEIGAGARQSDLVDGTSESEFIVRGGLDYLWNFSETAAFSQLVAVEAGDVNTYVESVTALKATLMGDLALVASYTVKHNTDVLPLTEKTTPKQRSCWRGQKSI